MPSRPRKDRPEGQNTPFRVAATPKCRAPARSRRPTAPAADVEASGGPSTDSAPPAEAAANSGGARPHRRCGQQPPSSSNTIASEPATNPPQPITTNTQSPVDTATTLEFDRNANPFLDAPPQPQTPNPQRSSTPSTEERFWQVPQSPTLNRAHHSPRTGPHSPLRRAQNQPVRTRGSEKAADVNSFFQLGSELRTCIFCM